jgi:hypothetical protein
MPKYIDINKKPVEIVHELKDKYRVPSFEEFMKSYERDEKINYADLGYSDIVDSKGYGPCEYSGCSHSSSVRFYVRMGFDEEGSNFKF